jgi:hypothetical protein
MQLTLNPTTVDLSTRSVGKAVERVSDESRAQSERLSPSLKRKDVFWHAWIEGKRGPWEGEDAGQIFHFFDIGYYDSEAAAVERGIAWRRVSASIAARLIAKGGLSGTMKRYCWRLHSPGAAALQLIAMPVRQIALPARPH